VNAASTANNVVRLKADWTLGTLAFSICSDGYNGSYMFSGTYPDFISFFRAHPPCLTIHHARVTLIRPNVHPAQAWSQECRSTKQHPLTAPRHTGVHSIFRHTSMQGASVPGGTRLPLRAGLTGASRRWLAERYRRQHSQMRLCQLLRYRRNFAAVAQHGFVDR